MKFSKNSRKKHVDSRTDVSFLDEDKTFRQYAWSYFSLHADQRLKAFQYFITLETALIAGFLILIRNDQTFKWMGILGVLLSLFAFIFWKIDKRTKMLVRIAEQALMELDDAWMFPDEGIYPSKYSLFRREKAETTRVKALPLVQGTFTYSQSFNWIFLCFGVLGVVAAITSFVVFK